MKKILLASAVAIACFVGANIANAGPFGGDAVVGAFAMECTPVILASATISTGPTVVYAVEWSSSPLGEADQNWALVIDTRPTKAGNVTLDNFTTASQKIPPVYNSSQTVVLGAAGGTDTQVRTQGARWTAPAGGVYFKHGVFVYKEGTTLYQANKLYIYWKQ